MKITGILFMLCLSQLTASAQVISFVIDEAQLDQSLKDTLERLYRSDQSVRMAMADMHHTI